MDSYIATLEGLGDNGDDVVSASFVTPKPQRSILKNLAAWNYTPPMRGLEGPSAGQFFPITQQPSILRKVTYTGRGVPVTDARRAMQLAVRQVEALDRAVAGSWHDKTLQRALIKKRAAVANQAIVLGVRSAAAKRYAMGLAGLDFGGSVSASAGALVTTSDPGLTFNMSKEFIEQSAKTTALAPITKSAINKATVTIDKAATAGEGAAAVGKLFKLAKRVEAVGHGKIASIRGTVQKVAAAGKPAPKKSTVFAVIAAAIAAVALL